MSLTLNMVGGGGGGLSSTDALLRVQAPAGSTVTITKGSTTKTDQGHENADDSTVYDYYFIIHQSQFDSTTPWTVTATLGTQTASDTVTVNAANEYDIELSFSIYLFKAGDQCTSITGGWTSSGWSTSGASTYSGTMQDGKMTIGGDGNVSRVLATNQSVSFGGKTLLTVEANTLSTYGSNPAGVVELYDSKGSLTATRRFAGASVSGTHGSHTVTIDLSSLSRTGGFVAVRNGGADASYKYEVYNIWLS